MSSKDSGDICSAGAAVGSVLFFFLDCLICFLDRFPLPRTVYRIFGEVFECVDFVVVVSYYF